VLLLGILLVGCSTAPSARPTATETTSAPTASPPAATESSLPTPAPSGFAFSDEGVIGYYQGQGFVCDDVQPSTSASGFFYQGCQKVDAKGRTLVIGLTTDAAGTLADGFASVQGAAGETILDPTDAMDHLAGFLGAMLGDVRGTSLVEWLAGHLGDAFAQTTVDILTVATYTHSASDHSRLYVELAGPSYLNAPGPTASP